jgi:hypothetical protein
VQRRKQARRAPTPPITQTAGSASRTAEFAARPGESLHERLKRQEITPILRDDASDITRDAIKAIGGQALDLYRLLLLDGPNVESLRPIVALRAKAARKTATVIKTLVRDLERLWSRVEASMADAPWAWRGASRHEDYREYACVEMARITAGARAAADRAGLKAKREGAAVPRRDDKGVTSTSHVGAQLIELVDRLSSHDRDRWTIRAVAQLITASQDDWCPAPCSDLARRYADDSNALIDWTKTRVARERRARKKRRGQGTKAR